VVTAGNSVKQTVHMQRYNGWMIAPHHALCRHILSLRIDRLRKLAYVLLLYVTSLSRTQDACVTALRGSVQSQLQLVEGCSPHLARPRPSQFKVSLVSLQDTRTRWTPQLRNIEL
jgi:hypothetical protein